MSVREAKLIVSLIDRLTGPSRAINGALSRLTAAQERNSQRLNAMRGRMLEAGAVAYGFARAVSAPIKSAMALESVMADVAKVTNFDQLGLKQFEQGLRRLATTEIPLAVTELAELAAAAAQSGVPETDLTEFTKLTAKAAVAWEVTGGEAGEALAKIRTALNLSNPQLFLYADAINHLSDSTAASAPDMVDFSRRVASQGEFFGFSATETLAFGAAMVSAGAQSEVAATSFRNMGRALTKGTAATKAQRTAYQALGLNAVAVSKEMQQDAVGTTIKVIERLNALPRHMQASVMSSLFGDEARALAPLIGRIDILKDALGQVSAETTYAGSVSKEFENRSRTTANALQLFQNRLNELGISIGAALLPALNDIMAALGPIISRMAAFAEAHPQLTRVVIAASAALIGLRVAGLAAQFGLLWMKGGLISAGIAGMHVLAAAFAPVTTALRALRFALLGTGIGIAIAAIAAAGTWIWNNWSNLSAMFKGFGDAFMLAISPLRPVLDPVIDGVSSLVSWIGGLLGPIEGAERSFGAFGVVAGRAVGQAVMAVVELPGKIGALAVEMYEAGRALGKSIYDGVVSLVAELAGYIRDKLSGALSWVGDRASGLLNKITFGYAGTPSEGIDGARASGGAVRAGGTYLVGEKGPELFSPGRSGAISPHAAYAAARAGSAAGGVRPQPASIVVNVGAPVIHAGGISDIEAVARKLQDVLGIGIKNAVEGAFGAADGGL